MATVEVVSAQSAFQDEKAEETNQIIDETTAKEEAPKQAEEEPKVYDALVEQVPQENQAQVAIIPDEKAKDEDIKEKEENDDQEQEFEEAKAVLELEDLELDTKEGGVIQEESSKVAPEPEEIEPNEAKKPEEISKADDAKVDAQIAPEPADAENAPITAPAPAPAPADVEDAPAAASADVEDAPPASVAPVDAEDASVSVLAV